MFDQLTPAAIIESARPFAELLLATAARYRAAAWELLWTQTPVWFRALLAAALLASAYLSVKRFLWKHAGVRI